MDDPKILKEDISWRILQYKTFVMLSLLKEDSKWIDWHREMFLNDRTTWLNTLHELSEQGLIERKRPKGQHAGDHTDKWSSGL